MAPDLDAHCIFPYDERAVGMLLMEAIYLQTARSYKCFEVLQPLISTLIGVEELRHDRRVADKGFAQLRLELRACDRSGAERGDVKPDVKQSPALEEVRREIPEEVKS
jgi:hypothetical protein